MLFDAIAAKGNRFNRHFTGGIMSGGYFAYNQYRLSDLIDGINRAIAYNKPGEEGYTDFSPATIRRFKIAARTLAIASEMVQRIDWLLSGDDGEDDFHERWNDNISRLLNGEDRA